MREGKHLRKYKTDKAEEESIDESEEEKNKTYQ